MGAQNPSVLIVGAGHAGLEAAFAAARVGARVRVVTGSIETVGQTPCNPSVGGVAKGHLVHEIEALGGFMGRAADANAIHGRRLNLSKGPAVHSTRLQVDKMKYGAHAREALLLPPELEVIEGLVDAIEVEAARVVGVRLQDGSHIEADAVVVTTGTFLGGVLHTGARQTPGGRAGEAPARALSVCLSKLGFRLVRLKTGTPPRLRRSSLRLDELEAQGSDDPFPRFCSPLEPEQPRRLPQVHCYITHTNAKVHDAIRENIGLSPMYSGQIKGVGPRYCPSIEDKVVRFADKDRHQIFLEPEGLDSELVYPNGISTSLPAEVQETFVRGIVGLEQAEIVRPGYAVEYDAVDARALNHELQSKDIHGLFFAGQINGTSGYEEAGAQGLVAGANAAARVLGRPGLVVERDEGYTGVMIDDLVTQGCDEPYRMFTSRAEFRMVLREDNAEDRLNDKAHGAGLIDAERHARVDARVGLVDDCERHLAAGTRASFPACVEARASARRVYAGYIERQRREVERLRGDGTWLPLPADLDYFELEGLNREAAERLAAVRPVDTRQAARIPGITPAAVACVWAHARKRR